MYGNNNEDTYVLITTTTKNMDVAWIITSNKKSFVEWLRIDVAKGDTRFFCFSLLLHHRTDEK